MSFIGAILAKAIRATFRRRRTELPVSAPVALTSAFVDDDTVGKRWSAFVRRSGLDELELAKVTEEIWAFLNPVTASPGTDDEFQKRWERVGPWC